MNQQIPDMSNRNGCLISETLKAAPPVKQIRWRYFVKSTNMIAPLVVPAQGAF